MTVIWDGTPSKPLGRMLFAPESTPTVMAPPVARPGGRTALVLATCRAAGSAWVTVSEIATQSGVSRDQAAWIANALARKGYLRRERKHAMRGRIAGVLAQRYQWVSRP